MTRRSGKKRVTPKDRRPKRKWTAYDGTKVTEVWCEVHGRWERKR